MSLYFKIRQKIVNPVSQLWAKAVQFNMAANAINDIKKKLRNNNIVDISDEEKKAAKSFFKSKGYNLKNTHWHRYYKGMNGSFYENYIPEDIFRSIISPKLNQMLQWPALLDKNLYYDLFKDFNQPKLILSNINGFYYVDGKLVSKTIAIETCLNTVDKMIIKPSIDSGGGFMIKAFLISDFEFNKREQELDKLFNTYMKDFVIQEFVDQSLYMKKYNSSTLNTLRIMSYLSGDKVHILSSVIRIGKEGNDSDNYSIGGIICGVTNNGKFRSVGYDKNGMTFKKTNSGILFEGSQVPNYKGIKDMVCRLHKRVPYFRIISWDIGLDFSNNPIFIEFNTYHQATELHQVTNGPLFGEFTDKILCEGIGSIEE
jgi:hypothetical protein